MEKRIKKENKPDNWVDDGFGFFKPGVGINLELAGIFYVAATIQIKEGERRFEQLENEIKQYEFSYRKQITQKKRLTDNFYVRQLRKLRNMEVVYEPVVRHFSTAKILLCCCAETFINEVAGTKLSGRNLEEFDKLSIIGKWLFIQDILKFKKRITIDKNPLQDFNSLVKERNKLVHFKGLKKRLHPLEIPDFLTDLALRPVFCHKNMNAVKILIQEFESQWTSSSGPDWLNAYDKKYRNPCFFIGSREGNGVLYSDKYDRDLY